MARKITLAAHVKEAAIARCDLNILYGVIALLEGGTISAARYSEVRRIIKICKEGAARSLTAYDRHINATKEGWEQ